MQLYFIRHGQSQNNWLYASTQSWEGRSEDPDLTPLGRQQAERLAQFLQQSASRRAVPFPDPQNVGGFGITHLYCSLMVRAIATGTVVARALGLPLVAWEEIHEAGGIHHKDPETGQPVGQPGNNRAYFEAHHPGLVLPDSLADEGWWNRPFEDRDQRPARARRFLDQLIQQHGNSTHRVAIISHGGFYSQFMRSLLSPPAEPPIWFGLNNVGITRLDFDEDHIWVQYMNRTDFLPRDMIT
jgi:2,3-bisphosphoglycerate-dependent phosphoglycerate mutase